MLLYGRPSRSKALSNLSSRPQALHTAYIWNLHKLNNDTISSYNSLLAPPPPLISKGCRNLTRERVGYTVRDRILTSVCYTLSPNPTLTIALTSGLITGRAWYLLPHELWTSISQHKKNCCFSKQLDCCSYVTILMQLL